MITNRPISRIGKFRVTCYGSITRSLQSFLAAIPEDVRWGSCRRTAHHGHRSIVGRRADGTNRV